MNEKKQKSIIIGLTISAVINVCLVMLLIFNPLYRSNINDLPEEFNILDEAWNILNNDFIHRETIDSKKLSEGAVNGMVMALNDKYSSYLSPEMHTLEISSFRGKFYGIGAYVGSRNNQLVIITPMEGSPAQQMGLEPGDVILRINDEDTVGMSVTEAALKIQGPADTKVKLTILREKEEFPFDVTITRKEITLKSVFWEMKDDVAYIRLIGFSQNTTTELIDVLRTVQSNNALGIILDIRNNGGGLLNIAVDVTSQFIKDGIVVKSVNNKGQESIIPVKAGGLSVDMPLIVLVNNGSASASEVVAGALQDYGRAKLLGQQTFGKGSVQIVRTLSDGSAIHVTAAHWLTPSGRMIEGVGLQPDLYSELKDDELVDFAVDYLKGIFKINPSYE